MTYATGRKFYDADSHLMELPDFLSRHAPAAMREELNLNQHPLWPGQFRKFDKGEEIVRNRKHVGDHLAQLMSLGDNLITGPKGYGALGAFDHSERVQALDFLGFESQLVFATFGTGVCLKADRSKEWRYAAASAHNRAMAEFCGQDRRMRGAGLLLLEDPALALKEIDHIIKLGLNGGVRISAMPAGGRSPGHPDLDPVWARLAAEGLPFLLHIGAPVADHANPDYLNDGFAAPTTLDAGGEVMLSKDMIGTHHPFESYISAMVLDGVFERHPALRGVAAEIGAGWVPAMLTRLDWIVSIWSKPEPRLKSFTRTPTQQLIDQMVFTPYVFEDVGALIKQSDSRLYVFSSDYPHVEGGRSPIERFERSLGDASEADKTLFYSGNYGRVYGLPA